MKRLLSRSLLLAALAVSGLTASHAWADEAAAPSDSELAASVKQALDAEPELKALDLKVVSKKSEVTIDGVMSDDQQMLKAGLIAEKVPGVKYVINNMQPKN